MDDNNCCVNNNNETTNKWKCEFCTYENWQSAIKCTICANKRIIQQQQQQPDQQQQSTNNDLINQDIYKIGNLFISSSNDDLPTTTTPPTTTTTNQQRTQLVDKVKWTCPTCTYLNWPNSKKCVQCHTVRASITPTMATTSTGVGAAFAVSTNSSQSSPRNSPRSPNSPSTAPKNDTNLRNALNVAFKKWSCKVCTYQNWPKSQRCTMCYTQRTIDSPTITNANTNQQPYNELDRLFLAACKGVVENDLTYLHKYLQAGGDITRYLRNDEATLLNQTTTATSTTPASTTNQNQAATSSSNNNNNTTSATSSNASQIFVAGLTLVHLCYKYKLKEYLMTLLSLNTNKNQQLKLKLNSIQQQQQQHFRQLQQQQQLLLANTKFPPCQSSPQLASKIIDRYFSSIIRHRKFDNLGCGSSCGGGGGYGANGATGGHSPSPTPQPDNASSLDLSNSCAAVTDCHTFLLPANIENEFSPRIQNILFDELLDRDVQYELEVENKIINWNADLTKRLSSRLYPLWNRHSGDCLLDSVLQSCYGVFDTDNTLRKVMAECLDNNSSAFKIRWKEHESQMAHALGYTPDDLQLEHDWINIIALANQPGSSLEQAHIFALCHIFCRPIIIYSVKYVKSYRGGDNIGYTHFEGVYLPLLWDPGFCFRSPIVLGYTRGHFTSLVHLEHDYVLFNVNSNNNSSSNNATNSNNSNNNNSNNLNQQTNISNNGLTNSTSNLNNAIGGGGSCVGGSTTDFVEQVFYLPLTNNEGQLLPIHFLLPSEVGREHALLRQYFQLDYLVSNTHNCGLLVAQHKVAKRAMLVKQMNDEWLSYYRNMQIKEQMQQNIIEIEDNEEEEEDECDVVDVES